LDFGARLAEKNYFPCTRLGQGWSPNGLDGGETDRVDSSVLVASGVNPTTGLYFRDSNLVLLHEARGKRTSHFQLITYQQMTPDCGFESIMDSTHASLMLKLLHEEKEQPLNSAEMAVQALLDLSYSSGFNAEVPGSSSSSSSSYRTRNDDDAEAGGEWMTQKKVSYFKFSPRWLVAAFTRFF